MPRTYSRILSQISALQAQAAKIKQSGAGKALASVRSLVADYGFTAADVFGQATAKPSASRKAQAGQTGRKAKYADGKGNTWGGMGKRPDWLKEALAGGGKLEELATGSKSPAAKKSSSAPTVKRAKAATKKKRSSIKYKDDAGHSWTGMGPKPAWFKAALAAGKTPADLMA